MRTEVATRIFSGLEKPREGIISSGRITRLAQNIPSGGIQAVLRIRATVIVDCDTYSTQALQNTARQRLRRGAMTQPKRPKRNWDEGKKRARAKLRRVRITPWTIPNVIRRM